MWVTFAQADARVAGVKSRSPILQSDRNFDERTRGSCRQFRKQESHISSVPNIDAIEKQNWSDRSLCFFLWEIDRFRDARDGNGWLVQKHDIFLELAAEMIKQQLHPRVYQKVTFSLSEN